MGVSNAPNKEYAISPDMKTSAVISYASVSTLLLNGCIAYVHARFARRMSGFVQFQRISFGQSRCQLKFSISFSAICLYLHFYSVYESAKKRAKRLLKIHWSKIPIFQNTICKMAVVSPSTPSSRIAFIENRLD